MSFAGCSSRLSIVRRAALSCRRLSLIVFAVLLFFSAVDRVHAQGEEHSAVVVAGVAAYNRGDFAMAYRLLRAEADRGDLDGEAYLGLLYARGQGVAMDDLEALRLYTLSAKQGNGEGLNNVGYKYAFGTGIPVNINEAIRFFCAAITHGNPPGMNNLAVLLDQGKGVPRNLTEARNLWQQAGDRGYIVATVNLGLSLLQIPAQESDKQRGMQLIYDGANQGDVRAQKILRQSGYQGALPPVTNTIGRMRLYPRDAAPGHAEICGETIS